MYIAVYNLEKAQPTCSHEMQEIQRKNPRGMTMSTKHAIKYT